VSRSHGARGLAAAAAALGTVAVVAVLAAGAPGRSAQTLTVIADGLDNPRGVTLNRAGVVFVAESGKAGAVCFAKGTCLGTTGSVTRWRNGRKARVIAGLPSFGDRDGLDAAGPAAVAVDSTGALYVAMADLPSCATPAALPTSVTGVLGKVVRYTARQGVTRAADISGAECASNFDRAARTSSPSGIVALGPGRQLVADAGANALFDVRGDRVELVAVLPRTARGAASVPTSVAIGPDGAYYVGELVGKPARGKPRRWEARVWKVVPGQKPAVHLRGFNAITGLAFARDGTLFVTEQTVNPANENESRGAVVRITPDGKRARLAFGQLHYPSGAAVAPDGRTLYVANWSVLTGTPVATGPFKGKTGELVRITLP